MGLRPEHMGTEASDAPSVVPLRSASACFNWSSSSFALGYMRREWRVRMYSRWLAMLCAR
jgi:hypothetical protein